MKNSSIKRRDMLRLSGLAGAGFLVAGVARAADSCEPTAAQTEGPFYPVRPQRDRDADLTQVQGRTGVAKGDVVMVQGRVLNLECQPVKGALVEIWQACHTGKYNHPSDPNTAALDPDFQYWGRLVTDAEGSYQFKTIIPGAYPATENWMRPPHIHFKVSAPGQRPFTTQMYFEGNEFNEGDEILNALSPEQRKNVIVPLNWTTNPHIGPTTIFDITLNISGSRVHTPELD